MFVLFYIFLLKTRYCRPKRIGLINLTMPFCVKVSNFLRIKKWINLTEKLLVKHADYSVMSSTWYNWNLIPKIRVQRSSIRCMRILQFRSSKQLNTCVYFSNSSRLMRNVSQLVKILCLQRWREGMTAVCNSWLGLGGANTDIFLHCSRTFILWASLNPKLNKTKWCTVLFSM